MTDDKRRELEKASEAYGACNDCYRGLMQDTADGSFCYGARWLLAEARKWCDCDGGFNAHERAAALCAHLSRLCGERK